ncbi:hypothetical protein LJC72_03500 [Bacteroides sp. OttesenSCG-928-D19]|nr:hypothetical protein [Bacteroides sp. OttesenSCG-928-D19]
MKKIILWLLLFSGLLRAQEYTPLDKEHPVYFRGDYIEYEGRKILLDEYTFFVDGRLSEQQTAHAPFAFASVNEALRNIKEGTEEQPMTIYMAPYVYWIDDPDDPSVRQPEEGQSIPYGLKVTCNWLTLCGLTDDPEKVVLACRRGQTQGAVGNFTMFHLDGDGIRTENITFGNYCNVDLEYALLPELSRPKRSSTITQAQLIICNSDKVLARNTRFISRLNLCPFAGAKRILFDNCYFECTDDALCSTGVYLDCKFTFFSSKPFFNTSGTGAVFLNCDINLQTRNRQYFTKMPGPVTVVDTRFTSAGEPLLIGWTQDPTEDMRCYQYNVSLNGEPYTIQNDQPHFTVDMTGKPILNAYRLEDESDVVYNTYNLLRGADEWDPMGIKENVLLMDEKAPLIPTYLKISPAKASIESGVTSAVLTASVKNFGGTENTEEQVVWELPDSCGDIARLVRKEDGRCEIVGINHHDETKQILVKASTASGLESACELMVAPEFVAAPEFLSLPELSAPEKGAVTVHYRIDLNGREDRSIITWYRCTDSKGSNPVEVAVSRLDRPKQTYVLSSGDTGYYLMAEVAPKHLRCHPGKKKAVVSASPVRAEDVMVKNKIATDFQDFSVQYQPEVMPGFWTVDGYKPEDTKAFEWTAQPESSWLYGAGVDGASQRTGLLQAARGARLRYTPIAGNYGDMTLNVRLSPCKTAGQGFGSATGQYLDVFIKFDTQTLTGYALRMIRTTKYDRAVDFVLIRYENGMTTEISEPVSATCYRSECLVTLKVEGKTLSAEARTTAKIDDREVNPDLKETVSLQAAIEPSAFGGFGFQHTGTVGAGATMIHNLEVVFSP